MICYRDQWWCVSYKECKEPCSRALTPKVMEDAEKWWGDTSAPIDCRAKPKCLRR